MNGFTPEQFEKAIRRLTSCHNHVFVVDQAAAPALGVSPRGLDCLKEEFYDDWTQDD